MEGKVFLKHAVNNPKPIKILEGDLRWHNNYVVRVFDGNKTWEIPGENIAAIVFDYQNPEVRKSEKNL